MNKGFIVVDDIPVICAECERAEIWSYKLYCLEEDRVIHNSKPDWCPIRPIPERKMCTKSICISTEEYNQRKGWNACIDEIEGSAEK